MSLKRTEIESNEIMKGGEIMSQQYNSMSKVCATCSYWGRSGGLKQYGDYVELDSPM